MKDKIKYFIKFIKPYKFFCIILFIFPLIQLTLSLIQPIIWGKLLTTLFEKDILALIKILITLGVVFLLIQLNSFLEGITKSYVNYKITCDLQQKIFRNITKIKYNKFCEKSSGEYTERITKDTNESINLIINKLIPCIVIIIKIAVLLIIMIKMNFYMTLVVLLILPFTYLISKKKSTKLEKEFIDFKNYNDNFMGFLQYTFKEYKNIKLFNMMEGQIINFNNKTNTIGEKYYQISIISLIFQISISLISVVAEFSIFIVGSMLVIANKIVMESFIAFTSYSQQLQQAFFYLTNLVPQISKVKISINRMNELIYEMDGYIEKDGSVQLKDFSGKIEFKDVSFSYKLNNPILEDIELTFYKNATNIILGNNGSGKSTLINLLSRIYWPTSGCIYFDEIPIADISEASIRNNICVITQDNFLFNTTIKENLIGKDNPVPDFELDQICEKMNIKEFIYSLPQKYETIIKEDNSNLSVGQRQKLLLVRAALSKAKVLIFDEPSSALDISSKSHLQEVLNQLKQDRTLIIISHDIDLIKGMDYKFEIKDNKIIERR